MQGVIILDAHFHLIMEGIYREKTQSKGARTKLTSGGRYVNVPPGLLISV